MEAWLREKLDNIGCDGEVYASYLIAALDGEDNENCGLGARSQHTPSHVIWKKALQSAMFIKIYIHRNINVHQYKHT